MRKKPCQNPMTEPLLKCLGLLVLLLVLAVLGIRLVKLPGDTVRILSLVVFGPLCARMASVSVAWFRYRRFRRECPESKGGEEDFVRWAEEDFKKRRPAEYYWQKRRRDK